VAALHVSLPINRLFAGTLGTVRPDGESCRLTSLRRSIIYAPARFLRAYQGFSRSRDAPFSTAPHPETISQEQEPSQPRAGTGQKPPQMRVPKKACRRQVRIFK
jgi:hypothetical protein